MRIEYYEPESYYLLGQGQYVGITADTVLNRFKTAKGTLGRGVACRQAGCEAVTDFRRETPKHISSKVALPFAGKTDKLQSCMGTDRRRRSVHKGMVVYCRRFTSSFTVSYKS